MVYLQNVLLPPLNKRKNQVINNRIITMDCTEWKHVCGIYTSESELPIPNVSLISTHHGRLLHHKTAELQADSICLHQ